MADTRNRTPFYGAVPTSKLQADHVFMADGSTLQEQADKKFELIETITLTEDVAAIERNLNSDNDYYFFFETAAGSESAGIRLRLFNNNVNILSTVNANSIQTTKRLLKYSFLNDRTIIKIHSNLQIAAGSSPSIGASYENDHHIDKYDKVSFESSSATQLIPAGTVVYIYCYER